MMFDTGREARQTDHACVSCKTRDTCNGIIEFDGVAVTFADDDRGNRQLALREHVKCSQGMADRAKITANHKQDRNIECRHPVKHGALPFNRNHVIGGRTFDRFVLEATDAIERSLVQPFEQHVEIGVGFPRKSDDER